MPLWEREGPGGLPVMDSAHHCLLPPDFRLLVSAVYLSMATLSLGLIEQFLEVVWIVTTKVLLVIFGQRPEIAAAHSGQGASPPATVTKPAQC